MKRAIYLDNSMTTRPSEQAVSAMMPYFTDLWGSSSAPHAFGQQVYPSLEEAYRSLYTLLGANEEATIVFTSSGAEAVNHVIQSAYHDITRPTGKNQYITANIDEAPALMAVGRLERMGCVGKTVQVSVEAVADAITPRTALVSLSWANGMTGVIHPVAEIAKLCRDRGIKLHLDATHVLGKIYFELEDIGADFITFNGDHLHAPKGTGALYIKEKVPCSPFILGGIEQGGYRAGSFNLPGLISLGKAAEQTLEARDLVCMEVARLRQKFEEGITEGKPLFSDSNRLPNVSCMGFPGIANEAMLFTLSQKGVYGSIGGGVFQQIGLILEASGIEESLAHSAVNFSLSRETTEEEIERAIEIINDTAKVLKKSSEQLLKGAR